MHYHCEIVLPPTADVAAAVEQILKPFNEHQDKGEDHNSRGAFWDWWVIGGRWAGHKLMARYDQAKLDQFYAWLKSEKVTVSGLQCGKQELSPSSQAAKVDAKWNEMFPSGEFVPCPIFQHSNEQYANGTDGVLPGDIQSLRDAPLSMECSRVIIAKPHWDEKEHPGELEAGFMLCDSQWNGCNYMKVDWDGKLGSALEQHEKSLKSYREEYAEKYKPTQDWLVVTVDYHS